MQKQNDRFLSVLKLMENLPESRVNSIIDSLFAALTNCDTKIDTSVYEFHTEKPVACKKCGSIHFVKNGKDRHGHTRYLCRDCGKTFGVMTSTAVSGTHKSAATWTEYIRSMLEGCSLSVSAARCHISIQTAFTWRHKILNALDEYAFNHSLSGLVEIDEAWVRISYKGNHSKSKDFTMPRKSHKRGTDNREQSPGARACILCAVERNKAFSGIVACRGFLTVNLLEKHLENYLSDECIVITDGLKAYDSYFKNTNIEHIALQSAGYGQKPIVKGAYHLNNVNGLHSRLKLFLRKFNGVSTKYLGHYLALFLWMENNKHPQKTDTLCHKVSHSASYISTIQLRSFPPAPDYASAS